MRWPSFISEAIESRIHDSGDVHDPGVLREERPSTGEVMVKGVMHEPERVGGIELVDRLHHLRLVPQRAGRESQRFHDSHDTGILQHRPEPTQRGAQVCLPFAIARAAVVVAGNEAHRLGARGSRDPYEIPRLALPAVVPFIEALDLGHAKDSQAVRTRHRACLFGIATVEQRLAQVVSDLHADASKPGGDIDERGIARLRHRHVVQREFNHPVSSLAGGDAFGPGDHSVQSVRRCVQSFESDPVSPNDAERMTGTLTATGDLTGEDGNRLVG